MGHIQDSPVSNNIISNECMIYHMKVHIVKYNLGQKKVSKSKIHILPIYGQMDSKPAIVAGQSCLVVHSRTGSEWLSLSRLYFGPSLYYVSKGIGWVGSEKW